MKRKGLNMILQVGLILFAVYNIFWIYSVSKIYNPYKKAIGSAFYLSNCVQQEDGYTYGVSSPTYLSYVGNLSVSEDIEVEEDGSSDATCNLIIWPLQNGTYVIGVSILSGTVNGSENYSIDIMLDENMQLVGMYDDAVVELYNNSINKIKKLFDLANDKWEIFE